MCRTNRSSVAFAAIGAFAALVLENHPCLHVQLHGSQITVIGPKNEVQQFANDTAKDGAEGLALSLDRLTPIPSLVGILGGKGEDWAAHFDWDYVDPSVVEQIKDGTYGKTVEPGTQAAEPDTTPTTLEDAFPEAGPGFRRISVDPEREPAGVG